MAVRPAGERWAGPHAAGGVGTLVAPWPFYVRLLAAGKGKTVARTACRQKLLPLLNAMLKHRTPWQAQEVQGSKNRQRPP